MAVLPAQSVGRLIRKESKKDFVTFSWNMQESDNKKNFKQ